MWARPTLTMLKSSEINIWDIPIMAKAPRIAGRSADASAPGAVERLDIGKRCIREIEGCGVLAEPDGKRSGFRHAAIDGLIQTAGAIQREQRAARGNPAQTRAPPRVGGGHVSLTRFSMQKECAD